MKSTHRYWALKWRSKNKMDGYRECFIYDFGFPLLFISRKVAREYVKQNYSYIAKRLDLQREPHGWKVPRVVRINLTMEEK